MNCFVDQIQRLRVKIALEECSFQRHYLHRNTNHVEIEENVSFMNLNTNLLLKLTSVIYFYLK